MAGLMPNNPRSAGKGHPVMYGDPHRVHHFDPFPEGGGSPLRFVEWALDTMGCSDPSQVLHLCSGSLVTGTTVDIRPETNPDIVADCRSVPLPDESFDFIPADYAKNLYGTGDHYPTPFQIMKEATRLLRPGGQFGLLHTQVPIIRRPMKVSNVYGVTVGCGYNIRAWTLMNKTDLSAS
jgi:hypothetical protein